MVQGIRRPRDVRRAHLRVESGGANRAVPEEHLDGAEVFARVEEEGRERVAQHVGRDPLGQPGLADGGVQDTAHRVGADGLIRGLPREQVAAGRPLLAPVLAQQREQPVGEHGVALLVPLAVDDVDDLALAVDVRGTQRAGLGDAQSRAVGRHQDHAVLGRRDSGENLLGLDGSQDHRQLALAVPRPRNADDRLGPLQRDRVQEADGGQIAAQGGALQPLVPQREHELAHVRLAQVRGRLHEMADEPARLVEVQLLRAGPVASDAEILYHLLANVTHRVLLPRRVDAGAEGDQHDTASQGVSGRDACLARARKLAFLASQPTATTRRRGQGSPQATSEASLPSTSSKGRGSPRRRV